jgi:hypothetical protein
MPKTEQGVGNIIKVYMRAVVSHEQGQRNSGSPGIGFNVMRIQQGILAQ